MMIINTAASIRPSSTADPATGIRQTAIAVMLLAAGIPIGAASANTDTDLDEEVDDELGKVVSVEYENDIFVGADGGYTSGLRFSWSDQDKKLPRWLIRTAEIFPLFPEISEQTLWETSLGQSIFTPTDIAEPEYPPDDRPYAGWLNLGFHVGAVRDGRVDRLTVLIGVVGPAAGARRTQTYAHEITGSAKPVGWETQLPNEPTLLLAYDTSNRLAHGELGDNGGGWEFTPTAGMAISNAITEASAGFFFRIGKNLPRDIGPPRLGAVPRGSGVFLPTRNHGWYVFGGLDGRYVAHNIFLDGSLFRDTPSVEKRNWVGEASAGAVFQWGRNRVTYTTLLRSREFDNQDERDLYGAVSYTRLFN